ncbi:MAG: hypothetical protein HYY40_02215 [Bacteroidetes bacterium]|nr:hypothetical protein [Bacteroidota bacterium]
MEAIIRTDNKTLFETLLYFLKRLNISVETPEKTFHKTYHQTEKQKIQFSAVRLKTKGVKFYREEANER